MNIEAMKRWLEALEIGLEYARDEQFENARRYAGYERMAPDDASSVKQIEDAIVSLRQAIEQATCKQSLQVQQEPVAWMDEFGNVFPFGAQRGPKYLNEPMKPLYTVPPPLQPEQEQKQEPVVRWICKGCRHEYMKAPSSCDCMEGTEYERVAYYTSPPPRQPLTEEQINEFFQGMEPNNGFWLSFARAIEAAHGIKGKA